MTEQEFKDNVVFQEREETDGSLTIRATISAEAKWYISSCLVANEKEQAVKELKLRLKEQLLRHFYMDRRDEFRNLIMDLRTTNPMTSEIFQVIDKLVKNIHRSPPL